MGFDGNCLKMGSGVRNDSGSFVVDSIVAARGFVLVVGLCASDQALGSRNALLELPSPQYPLYRL